MVTWAWQYSRSSNMKAKSNCKTNIIWHHKHDKKIHRILTDSSHVLLNKHTMEVMFHTSSACWTLFIQEYVALDFEKRRPVGALVGWSQYVVKGKLAGWLLLPMTTVWALQGWVTCHLATTIIMVLPLLHHRSVATPTSVSLLRLTLYRYIYFSLASLCVLPGASHSYQ